MIIMCSVFISIATVTDRFNCYSVEPCLSIFLFIFLYFNTYFVTRCFSALTVHKQLLDGVFFLSSLQLNSSEAISLEKACQLTMLRVKTFIFPVLV